MKLLDHNSDKVTIELTLHELHLVNALIQEGRISHQCDSPEGRALEDGIRSIVIMVEQSLRAGQKNDQYSINSILGGMWPPKLMCG